MARCYRHPGRETNLSCVRCERPICPDCLRPAAVGYQCPECATTSKARAPTLPYGGRIAEHVGLVTLVIGALNVVAYVASAVTSPAGVANNNASQLFKRMVLNPAVVHDHDQFWRLLTSAFMHAGILHIAVNMFSLAVLGPGLERVLGRLRFAVLYLVSALGASVFVFGFGGELTSTVGASGAIFGLFGALVVVYRKLGLNMRALIPTVAINVYITWRVPNISWIGHLAGFAVGLVLAAIIVYAPREQRASIQILGIGAVLAILVGLTIWRNDRFPSGTAPFARATDIAPAATAPALRVIHSVDKPWG